MATRVTSSRLIGRAAELAELEAALADAAGGRATLAFIAGDSGVGKSRLLAELAERADARGARFIRGDCVELGEDELPYAAIIGALRPLVRAQEPAFDDLAPSARAALATLLPELGDREPGVADGRVRDPDADGRGRLFDALLALLDRLSRERPLVLALEDLHWADRSTRAHLVYLARSLWTERVLVVGTYRADELHRRHPLRPLLAELERDPRAVRVALEPLTPDEVAGQLADILGAPPAAELVERLFARSEGNPLFTEELLAAGLDGRGPLPETLRDALMVRVGRLGEPAQEVLRVLSAGRVLEHDVLAEASGLDDATLRAALRETVDANIVCADEHERLRFRHALLREVVHDDLLPGEHADLHLALARALEARAGAGDDPLLLAGVAHHYLSAGCQEDALRASVAAAGAAEAVHAPGEAAVFLERALDLWDRVSDPEAIAGADRVNLLARTGAAHADQGDYARAEALLERAIAEAGADADPHRTARLLERLAHAQSSLGRANDAGETIARAAELVPPGDPGVERARILAWQAKSLMLRGRYGETLPIAREAIEAADAAGSPEARGRALNALGIALLSTGEVEDGAAALREALAAARTVGDRCSAYVNLSDALHLVGRGREAREIAGEGLREAGEAGPAAAVWLRMAVAEIDWDHGEWSAARGAMPDEEAPLHGLTLVLAELLRAEMDLAGGDHDRARARLDRVGGTAADSREPQFIGWAGVLRGELERRAGALTAARSAIDDGLDAIEFCSDDRSRVARLAELGAVIEAEAAQRARDLGDRDDERLAVLRAEGYADRVRACAGDDRPVETARRRRAEAETAVARGAADPAAFAEAACAWEELGRPYPAALARLRLAETLIAAGDRAPAADALGDALEAAEALGATWLTAEARALAARARLGVPDGEDEAPRAAAEPVADDPFGLTPRERQVLALVAEGATNREIGAQLFMAEKTASVHVSRILAKLDVRSRTEAAGVAHRFGLGA